jgi:hypothetical protein
MLQRILRLATGTVVFGLFAFGQRTLEMGGVTVSLGMSRADVRERALQQSLQVEGDDSFAVLVNHDRGRLYGDLWFTNGRLTSMCKDLQTFLRNDDPLDLFQAVHAIIEKMREGDKKTLTLDTYTRRRAEWTMDVIVLSTGDNTYYTIHRTIGFSTLRDFRGVTLTQCVEER